MECEFPKSNATNDEIAEILRTSKIIAVVGLSPKPERPSHGVSVYMMEQGYTIIPVNPGQDEILGQKSYKSVLAVPGPIDIVNIFREPAAVPEIVGEAIAKKAKVVWMQEGIVHNEAADKARAAGLKVVMNKCLYKEHARL
jgi:predicted CoA-binding protein